MGQTLGIANDAHLRADRSARSSLPEAVDLPILVEKDRPLLNVYSVMEVNPANGPRVNARAQGLRGLHAGARDAGGDQDLRLDNTASRSSPGGRKRRDL